MKDYKLHFYIICFSKITGCKSNISKGIINILPLFFPKIYTTRNVIRNCCSYNITNFSALILRNINIRITSKVVYNDFIIRFVDYLSIHITKVSIHIGIIITCTTINYNGNSIRLTCRQRWLFNKYSFKHCISSNCNTGYLVCCTFNVCLKRKIRNFVELTKEGEAGYNILIKADKALNTKFTEAYNTLGLATKQKGKNPDDVKQARDYICQNYFDVRTFGAVMSTGDDPCGIVRGPVQLNFARSIDPVFAQDITITRQARTTEDRQQSGETEMGKKSIIPYALYRGEGYVSAMLAQKITGFSEDDLELLWTSIINMFEHDRSAARGKLCMRKLIVFKHDSALGNAPAHILFDKVSVKLKDGVTTPRHYSDYDISIDKDMPEGVTLIEKL